MQNYVVFQPMHRYFKRDSGNGKGNYIYFWKFKGFSDEILQLLPQKIINLTHC